MGLQEAIRKAKDMQDRKMDIVTSALNYNQHTNFSDLGQLAKIEHCSFNESFIFGKSWCKPVTFSGLPKTYGISDFIVLKTKRDSTFLTAQTFVDYMVFASRGFNSGIVKRAAYAFADGAHTWKEFKDTVLLGLDQIDNEHYE